MNTSKSFLKFCPNVKILYLREYSVLFKEDKEFLPRLECISLILAIDSGNDNRMKILSDKYSQTMKTLLLSLEDLTAKEVKTCVEFISRFKNLRQLQLTCSFIEQIDKHLSVIGQKLSKLLQFVVIISDSVPISYRFFNVFTHFKTIRKLSITVIQNTVLSGSVQCLKHCTYLYELEIFYLELTEAFFTNVYSVVPKLQFLIFSTREVFSDSFIDSFRSMKRLRRVEHHIIDFNIERNFNKKQSFGISVKVCQK